jgi:L-lactate dehydrogenase complex protein LldE
MPTIGLFIPCYVDQLFPKVGLATLDLLEQLGQTVEFPAAQTCCGQPMANTGCLKEAEPFAKRFIEIFSPYDYIVAPSGSCVAMVRQHYTELLHHEHGIEAAMKEVQAKTFELCEFMTDVLKVDQKLGTFKHRVGLHQSCHGQRGLGLAQMSELVAPGFSKSEVLLKMVGGLELIALGRKDECCGFGGTFCVSEEAVSVKMGKDRVTDHLQHGADYITGSDMSCLMHLEGILKRQKSGVKVVHIAEILNA